MSWLMALPLLLSVASCSTDETADVAGEQWVVTAIMGANGLGDRSYSDLIYSGLRQSENALDITLRVIVPTSYEEAEPYFDAWLNDRQTTPRRLLIAASGEYEAYLKAKADRLPDQDNARVMLLESAFRRRRTTQENVSASKRTRAPMIRESTAMRSRTARSRRARSRSFSYRATAPRTPSGERMGTAMLLIKFVRVRAV